MPRAASHDVADWAAVAGSIALAAVCWGVYGPVLHKGQLAMQGSRLRPFICVGLAYFLIAVLVPLVLLGLWTEQGNFTPVGSLWSLAGGTAGAVGALGVILAFTFGGKPVYVMPVVFGGAPVINALVIDEPSGHLEPGSPALLCRHAVGDRRRRDRVGLRPSRRPCSRRPRPPNRRKQRTEV